MGAVDCLQNLSKAETSILSDIRDMSFEIWYNHIYPTRRVVWSRL